MSVTYSTDIKTGVKLCYDMGVTVYRLFSGLFLTRTANVRNRHDSQSLDAVASLDMHVNV